MLRPLVTVGVLIALCSCATVNPHAELEPAPTEGSFDERRAYYKAHALDDKTANHVFLHGGTRVYYPEDLLPAVAEDSPTAKAITEHIAAREKIEAWTPLFNVVQAVALTGGVVAIGSMSGFFFAIVDPSLSELGSYVVLGGLIGGVGLMGAALVLMLGWNTLYDEELRAAGETADRAWRTYPQSLTDNVDVGVNADGILFDLRKANVYGPANALGGLIGEVPDDDALEEETSPTDDPADAPPPPPPIED